MNECMFVGNILKNFSTDFDENCRDCFQRYRQSLDSSLNHVGKYIKCLYIQSATGGYPTLAN